MDGTFWNRFLLENCNKIVKNAFVVTKSMLRSFTTQVN